LPTPRTRLLGREAELAAACAFLLHEAVPILTLTGPGGVGKTRLALAVAQDVAGNFADGVVWVDLASLADPALAAAAVAASLGVAPSAERSLAAALVVFLRPQQRLLLLDNCEHVLAAVADLVSVLLANCPALQILATSRAPLRVQGEQALAVPPLPVPEHGAALLERVQDAPAVRLFVHRARAVDADFVLDARNAAAVAQICQRLDGLPLAIELAAARANALSPAALLALLTQRLRVLAAGPRDVPARHQTIRDAIAWSYDLLAPNEQAFFRRLAVFAGGCTLDAAAAVVAASADAAIDVLGSLAVLVDHSLLRRVDGPDGDGRWRMLETVREYGLERLAEAGEEEAARQAHAAWFVAFAERVYDEAMVQARMDSLPAMESDHDNIRAALAWLEGRGDAEGLVRLTGSASAFWFFRSCRVEGRDWLERALALDRSSTTPAQPRIRTLHAAGMFARNHGDYAHARRRAEECLALARAEGDGWGTAMALQLLGFICISRGAYTRAREHYEASLAVAKAIGDRLQIAQMGIDLGMAAYGEGDLTRAMRHLTESLDPCREIDEQWSLGLLLNALGLVSSARGDRQTAATCYTENLALWQRFGSRENLAECLAGIAMFATPDQPAHAARLFGAADRLRAELGHAFVYPERLGFDRAESASRAVVGEEAFAALWREGHAWTLEQTVDEAAALLRGEPETRKQGAMPVAPTSATPRPGFDLTRREQEILSLLCQRLTDQEIAERLFLSPRTVHSHVAHILAKLGAANRRGAAATAARLGLV
jgi:non-specific serine/threonine protein kinase